MYANTLAANFEPISDFVHEGECDTLLLHLPGFKKEQLRVQLARSGVLKISGTQPTGDNKWTSFQKNFPVSTNCDTSKITAKFEDGILYVRQPKLIVPVVPDKKLTHSPKTPLELPSTTTTTTKTDHEEPHKAIPDKPVPNKELVDTETSDDTPETTASRAHIDKLLDGCKVTKMEVGRQKMTRVLVVVLAFALGMCINKMQAWFSCLRG